jgi:two-component system OmpR family response regulator
MNLFLEHARPQAEVGEISPESGAAGRRGPLLSCRLCRTVLRFAQSTASAGIVSNKSPTVALLDDDPRICALVSRLLSGEGYHPLVVSSRRELLDAIEGGVPDAVILDLGLPKDDGIEIAREIRRRSQIALLMLTARNEVGDRVLGLDSGADDYIVKPFDPEELMARLRSALRRRPPKAAQGPARLRLGSLDCDPRSRLLRAADGREQKLTERELDLLLVLARSAGRAVSRERLSREGLGREWNPLDRSVDVHIAHLRTKMRALAPQETFLASVRTGGYQLVAPVEPL